MRHVRCMLAIARNGSVTAAAADMGTSQPALSRSLAELEEIIGTPLFVRNGRGLTLTEAGHNFHRHLDMAVSQIETGAAMASGTLDRPAIAVGMLPNVSRTLAVDASSTFKAASPNTDLHLHWAGIPDLIGRLHRDEIDFLLGRLLSLEHLAKVSFEHLYTEAIVFVVANTHPLARMADTATLDDVRDELAIVPLPNTIVRRELDKFLMARGISRFERQIETVSFEFMRSYVDHYPAVACLPIGAVRQELADGRLVKLNIHGEELVSSVGMTFVTGRRLSNEAQAFGDCVREAALKYS